MSEIIRIQFFRGNFAAMPLLEPGEPGFCLDSGQLFVGNGLMNVPIGGGGVPIGNFGDITVSSGGTVWTINASVITLAKMANLISQRIIGRNTTGTGAPELVTIEQALDWIGTSNCSILWRDGSDWQALAGIVPESTVGVKSISGSPQIAFQEKGSIWIVEEYVSGTNGGTFTSGAWQKRLLNTVEFDTHGDVTLIANDFTLAAGTYDLHATAPGVNCNQHQIRLYDVTNAMALFYGSSEFAVSTGASTNSLMHYRIQISAPTTYRIEHQCAVTAPTFGFGVGNTFGPSFFAQVWIRREF